jgi:hypothetical protein
MLLAWHHALINFRQLSASRKVINEEPRKLSLHRLLFGSLAWWNPNQDFGNWYRISITDFSQHSRRWQLTWVITKVISRPLRYANVFSELIHGDPFTVYKLSNFIFHGHYYNFPLFYYYLANIAK